MAKENSQGNRLPKSTKKKTVKKKSPAKKSTKPNAGRIECKYSKLEPINKLNPNPQNPNIHTEEQIDKLAELIRLHGWRLPIIVSDRSGLIVAGHGRLLAAKKLGLDAAPVDFQSFKNEAEEYAVLISDNVIAELSSFDGLKMAELLNELDNYNVDLEAFTALSEEQILEYIHGPDGPPAVEGLTDDDAIPEKAPAKVKKGDIWQLGEHRLLCGDSTKAEDVERLMDGEKADMVFTDPPYGVDYEGKTKDKLKIKNDSMTNEELAGFIFLAFKCADEAMRDGAYCLATVPAGPLHLIFASDWLNRGWLRQILVWNKDSMVLGHSEYHYKHEPILFGWKQGDRLKSDDRTKTTVWDFERPKRSKDHPTMKPVAMWEYGISNHTKAKDLLYEPFCGSGTSIIACEKTDRKCYGIEIDPHYCDVIIKRWEDFTGKKANKVKK